MQHFPWRGGELWAVYGDVKPCLPTCRMKTLQCRRFGCSWRTACAPTAHAAVVWRVVWVRLAGRLSATASRRPAVLRAWRSAGWRRRLYLCAVLGVSARRHVATLRVRQDSVPGRSDITIHSSNCSLLMWCGITRGALAELVDGRGWWVTVVVERVRWTRTGRFGWFARLLPHALPHTVAGVPGTFCRTPHTHYTTHIYTAPLLYYTAAPDGALSCLLR